MAHFVGLDVSVEYTSICVMDAGGTVLHESKVKSTPAAISRALHRHAPEAERIGIEAGASSSWLCRQLREAGHPIIHMESRHAHRGLSMRLNKTDKNDARGLADLMRVGWFKSVHSRALDSQYTRSMLLARKRLVDTRRQFENQLRNIMKVFGCMLGSTAGRGFVQRVETACKNDPVVHRLCEPILRLVRELRLQINAYERQLRSIARHDEVTRRMMTVPGIGALTALAFKSSIDDPHRFRRSADVGAFLGLTPRRYQSGEIDWTGRISRLGDGLVRTYLFEAASVLTGKIERWSRLKAWGVRLAKRVGMKKARVAVARKLAVVLHCIWVDGTEFEWGQAVPA